jgi:hypothetical protein
MRDAEVRKSKREDFYRQRGRRNKNKKRQIAIGKATSASKGDNFPSIFACQASLPEAHGYKRLQGIVNQ